MQYITFCIYAIALIGSPAELWRASHGSLKIRLPRFFRTLNVSFSGLVHLKGNGKKSVQESHTIESGVRQRSNHGD
jgi:hypothetical protein